MDSFTKIDQAQRGDAFHRHNGKPSLWGFQLRAFGVHPGFERFMKFFFQPTRRIHLRDLARLLEVQDLEIGQQNPLQRFNAGRWIWLPDTNRHTGDWWAGSRRVSGGLRRTQDHWREAYFQSSVSRRLPLACAQFQPQLAATRSRPSRFKQFASALTIFRQQCAILVGANDEALILL